jgi:hypothetical protein
MRKQWPPRRTQISVERYTSRLERWPNRDRVVGEAWRLALFNAWFINGLLQPNATIERENPIDAREDARPAQSTVAAPPLLGICWDLTVRGRSTLTHRTVVHLITYRTVVHLITYVGTSQSEVAPLTHRTVVHLLHTARDLSVPRSLRSGTPQSALLYTCTAPRLYNCTELYTCTVCATFNSVPPCRDGTHSAPLSIRGPCHHVATALTRRQFV